MKKIILSLLVVGSLMATSCKKAAKDAKDAVNATENAVKDAANATGNAVKDAANATKDAAAKVGDMVESAIEGVSIPTFENAKVTENLKSYAAYAKEYIAAGTDAAKNTKLMEKGAKILAEGKELTKGLDAEAAAKYKKVLSSIQAKMAPVK